MPAASVSTLPLPTSNPEVLEELRRVLDSHEFAGSERGSTLLTYLVENALEGGLDRLKERTIGVEIFGREATYDTGQDAIVRVSANSIRKRLATYYARMDGAGERPQLRIYLAPGSYTPEFLVEPTAQSPVSVPAATTPVSDAALTHKPSRWVYRVMLSLLSIACVALGVQNWRLRNDPAPPPPLRVLPWSMFGTPGEVRIVLTDGNFAMHKFLDRREMALSEYSSAKWLWNFKPPSPGVTPLPVSRFTSVASAVTASRISSLIGRSGWTPAVRSARDLQLRDFKDDKPIVLLGSAPSNPWVELFDDRLNFVIEVDLEKRIQRIRNRSPRPGEEPYYIAKQTMGTPGTAYAVISELSNLDGKTPVLIIAGSNAEATEAAGELATDIPRLTRELQKLGVDPFGKVSQFELLIRVHHLNDAASRTEVVAHRVTQ